MLVELLTSAFWNTIWVSLMVASWSIGIVAGLLVLSLVIDVGNWIKSGFDWLDRKMFC